MSLVNIPELEPESNSWVVSERNGKRVVGEWSDEKIVGSFTKEEHFVETSLQFLKKVDERIVDRKKEIKELENIKSKLLSNPELKEKYENFVSNAWFWYGNEIV